MEHKKSAARPFGKKYIPVFKPATLPIVAYHHPTEVQKAYEEWKAKIAERKARKEKIKQRKEDYKQGVLDRKQAKAERNEAILEFFKNGYTHRQIAERFGLPVGTVQSILKKFK